VLAHGDAFFSGGERVPADGYTWSTMNVPDRAPIGWVADQFLVGSGGWDAGSGGYSVGDRTTTTIRLNFRSGPGTSNPVIRPLAPGTLLTITDGPVAASGYTWYQGRATAATGGDAGWVIEDGLTLGSPELPDPGVEYDVGAIVHVATDTLRMRSGAGTSAAIIARLPEGTTLTIAGAPAGASGYTWYPVTTPSGAYGWVACDYIAWGPGSGGTSGTGSSGGFEVGATVTVDTPRLNFRAAPGTDAAVLDTLDGGTALTVLGGPEAASGYHWYRVETSGGAIGWVIGEALAPR
jgi:uncharacterized protein YgiM (DUF1202 family)